MIRRLVPALAVVLLAAPAIAQDAPVEVTFTGTAAMPSIADGHSNDTFNFTIADKQFKTTLSYSCTPAGHNEFGFIRKDRICTFGKDALAQIVKPDGTAVPRTQFTGQYTVTASGLTLGETMGVNYLAVSAALPAQNNVKFGGSLNLKPEQTSTGAAALKDAILAGIGQGGGGGTVDQKVDTIDFNKFVWPSTGLPANMDPGTTLGGNCGYSYQTYSWYCQISAEFKGTTYQLTGNMPFTGDSETEGGTSTYNLVLTLPGQSAGKEANSFDDLFADATNTDLFAQANGITGTLTMENTRIATTTVDGDEIKTPGNVVVTGKLTGQGVPLEVVRTVAYTIGLLGPTFFGP